MFDFGDGATFSKGQYVPGYFRYEDYLDDSVAQTQGFRSNEADMIYMRGKPPDGWPDNPNYDFYDFWLTVLIHEYQHLVQFCITVWTQENIDDSVMYSMRWIGEMIAMAAQTMYYKEKLQVDPSYTHLNLTGNGYIRGRVNTYNQDSRNVIRNGHGLTYWDWEADINAGYALAYLLGQYLAIHSTSGQAIFKEIYDYMIENNIYDYRAVAAVASENIPDINSWEELLKSWAIANMANQPTGLYGYKGEITLTPHGPTSDKVDIYNGGAVYRIIEGSWSVPEDAGENIRFFSFEVTTSTTSSTTTVPPSSTTTSDASQPCPSESIYGKDSEETEILRYIRDEVLSQTPEGREIIKLYYQWSPAIVQAMEEDEAFKEEVRGMMDGILELIE